ncbi:Alpha/Beta hydrolase protein [Xylariaceae sp. FL0804]|nr:Alpha/Beta hydrolase protein [Xylariaceae sp. FL0804]
MAQQQPGMLCVTMQPRPGLATEQFDEWYNNEHGPTRLRLGDIFTTGQRYRATDGQEPAYLAAYDVASMPLLETDTYTTLRANRTPREARTIGQVDVSRYFWDLVAARQAPDFAPAESLTDAEAEGGVLVLVQVHPRSSSSSSSSSSGSDDTAEAEAQIRSWYEEEHFDMLAKVPGWQRSRLFRTSSRLEPAGTPVSLVGLHEYARANGLGGAEHQAAASTPRRAELLARHATLGLRRTFARFYVFGPAPRDLTNLARLPRGTPPFTSADGRTSTATTATNDEEEGAAAGGGPVLASYATVPADGLDLPYRLEGSGDADAPVIVFCNSLLTSLHMWDPFVARLRASRPGRYRLLRYDARGRCPGAPRAPATMAMLADDLAALLDALRIPCVDAVVGVSVGGGTALQFALRHRHRLRRFVACDFNAASSPANTGNWKERIALAESSSDGMRRLADVTVARWFHPDSHRGKPEAVRWMEDMVAANDLEGFRFGCQALWDYDLRGGMAACEVPGLLVAGEGDGGGALARAMDGFKDKVGPKGTPLRLVPGAGHLPMCEDPDGFWKAVEDFL